MDKEQLKKDIQKMQEVMNVHDAQQDALYALCGGVLENPALDIAVSLLDGIHSPVGEGVSWFIFENEFGRCGLEAGYDGDTKHIETVDDLIELLEGE